jgi:N-acetyl-1-D-myo-inositol-2-amino-2-deoxy-alpha-D-glucopyranoside deacetylase
MTSRAADRRLLFVHAHPDDESIETGATIAKYAAEGAQVALVTCTLGELGEIIPAELAHLAADADDTLGQVRTAELAAACAALGVTDHRFLGGPGRWRDSGMAGWAGNAAAGSFWQADVGEAAAELAQMIIEVRPQVVVSYDANGYYGHPDHIQAHRVAWRAHQDTGIAVKFYATAMPRSVLAEAVRVHGAPAAEDAGWPAGFRAAASIDDLPFGVPDDQVTTEIQAGQYLEAKLEAMRAHRTQIAVDGRRYALAGDMTGQRALSREFYTLLDGARGPGTGPFGREADLFAGIG